MTDRSTICAEVQPSVTPRTAPETSPRSATCPVSSNVRRNSRSSSVGRCGHNVNTFFSIVNDSIGRWGCNAILDEVAYRLPEVDSLTVARLSPRDIVDRRSGSSQSRSSAHEPPRRRGYALPVEPSRTLTARTRRIFVGGTSAHVPGGGRNTSRGRVRGRIADQTACTAPPVRSTRSRRSPWGPLASTAAWLRPSLRGGHTTMPSWRASQIEGSATRTVALHDAFDH